MVLKEILKLLVDNKDLTIILITSIGILTGIFGPQIANSCKKHRSNKLLIRSIEFYLYLLKANIEIAVKVFKISKNVGEFMEENKLTHDTLERLYLESGFLPFKKRDKLSLFIFNFKMTEMITELEQFNDYTKELEKVLPYFNSESLRDKIYKKIKSFKKSKPETS